MRCIWNKVYNIWCSKAFINIRLIQGAHTMHTPLILVVMFTLQKKIMEIICIDIILHSLQVLAFSSLTHNLRKFYPIWPWILLGNIPNTLYTTNNICSFLSARPSQFMKIHPWLSGQFCSQITQPNMRQIHDHLSGVDVISQTTNSDVELSDQESRMLSCQLCLQASSWCRRHPN